MRNVKDLFVPFGFRGMPARDPSNLNSLTAKARKVKIAGLARLGEGTAATRTGCLPIVDVSVTENRIPGPSRPLSARQDRGEVGVVQPDATGSVAAFAASYLEPDGL